MRKPTSHNGFEPMQDRVLVKPHSTVQKTAGGIILPEQAQKEIFGGIIMASGPGREGYEMTLELGDEVLYGQHSGFEVDIDGTKYKLIREADAYAKIKRK